MLQTDVQWDKNNITVLGFASLNPTYAKPYLLNGLYRSRLVGDKRQRLPVKVIRLLHVAAWPHFSMFSCGLQGSLATDSSTKEIFRRTLEPSPC